MSKGSSSNNFHRGYISILGRANVGKSTLLNKLLGAKIAAVSSKPQTSRGKLLGIVNEDTFQIGFLDTPGWPSNVNVDVLGRRMIREIKEAMDEANLIVLMVAPLLPGRIEAVLIEELKRKEKPVFLLINKVDTVKKTNLLPVIDKYNSLYEFEEIIPLSAIHDDISSLPSRLAMSLPKGEPLFDQDLLTDRSERFLVGELVREKVFELYGKEIPYATAVKVDPFEQKDTKEGITEIIDATIFVEKESQKGILVGQEGNALKEVGIAARKDIESLLQRNVYLNLWVKTKQKWRGDGNFLRELNED
ncbi:MAG: GTPase Era [Dehalococcoidia bacterium]